MPLYPIFLDIKNKPCLVIGGGSVANRKTLSLLSAGAKVTVISPTLTEGLKKLKKAKKILHIPRRYAPGDLKGFFLAVSTAGSRRMNETAHRDALDLKVLLNVADNPGFGNFIVPSVVERGDIKIAISTSGKSPYFAKTFRQALEKGLPPELAKFIEILGGVRSKLLKERVKSDKKNKIYADFFNSPVLEWIREGSLVRINKFLRENLGRGYSLSRLGIKVR
ncbi:MAG: bifunctional precorrin-2 dehydrogenase/sirohydrochlorin ferrochelatase [Deltaproteobacteria bacterium]|nr:bifunctional precorrin-2 dehydrogenase/sirohydrochlorin ferrochelatase [Deltaproteobacteria bacterium]